MYQKRLRENIFKIIYCSDFHVEEEVASQVNMYLKNVSSEGIFFEDVPEEMVLEEVSEEDRALIVDKVLKIRSKIHEIDEKINEVAIKWSTDRMAKIDLSILRLAYYEMKYDENVPAVVAIDQAVELAKKFGSDDSPKFINGILAKLI